MVATRRYTTDTICAYLCDRNKNCEGFQIYNDLQCILLAKKCETKDLMIFNGSSTDYYLKGTIRSHVIRINTLVDARMFQKYIVVTLLPANWLAIALRQQASHVVVSIIFVFRIR